MQNTKEAIFLIIQKILLIFFPQYCVLCGRHCKKKVAGEIFSIPLCQECQADLPVNIAVQCQEHAAETIIPFRYQLPINHFIGKLKFQHRLLYARLLGVLLARYVDEYYAKHHRQKPQIIIPMPLHNKRLKARGFNQALEIAKITARKLNIPIDRYSCVRCKNTKPQTLIPVRERKINVKRAFAVKRKLAYQHVAVLDDVTTTGSTLKEFCKVLKVNGVDKIDVWCCANAKNYN